MNDVQTVQFQADEELPPADATCEVLMEGDAPQGLPMPHRARFALTSLALATVVSTAAIHQDIPARERGVETAMIARAARPRESRQVSIGEARRIALAVMAEAESRRAAFAEHEAAMEAVWEESA